MNRHVLGALAEDAWRQVLDDRVFRILAVLSAVLILPTFLVALDEDGLSLPFGWKEWTYAELGAAGRGQVGLIAGVQEAIVQQLVGTFGLFFCIAATAFFVPRMLEKGAADTLFSKPVSRFALLAARYAAGVIFVALLAFVLVLGMHAGFLIRSGHSDPAFLWSALTLTYVFALVHSFSVAVAVVTRSSIAALLTTLIFFSFTGCIQQTWIAVEHADARRAEAAVRGDEATGEPRGEFAFLRGVLEGFHWVLPKTSDADYVVAGLRRAVTGSQPVFSDADGAVSVLASPEGFELLGPAQLDLSAEPAVWIARDESGGERARIEFARRDRSNPERPGKLLSTGALAAALEKEVATRPERTEPPSRSSQPRTDRLNLEWVRWSERDPQGAENSRARGLFALDAWAYEIDARFAPGAGDERDRALRSFVESLRVERSSASTLDARAWYARTFGWTSPPRHNAAVSIGTSLLFVALLLLYARWRLVRIDF